MIDAQSAGFLFRVSAHNNLLVNLLAIALRHTTEFAGVATDG